MERIYEAGGERQRVSVTFGDDGGQLSNTADGKCPYVAEPGERVEWVVEAGRSLYGAPPPPPENPPEDYEPPELAAEVKELKPRGDAG